MDNVTAFKTARNNSTALVVVGEMEPKEALKMHTSVKEQGRGAIQEFVRNETPYEKYGHYYYELKKLGVAPFKPRGPRKVTDTQSALEDRIQQLEMQISVLSITPARRAVEVLYHSVDEISHKSRSFLCNIIQRNSANLSPKQEKWLSDLESKLG